LLIHWDSGFAEMAGGAAQAIYGVAKSFFGDDFVKLWPV